MKKEASIIPILAVVFTNILGAGMVIPILPLYAVDTFGATDFQAALLTTAFFAAQFVAAPVLGQLSDRFGRRPILMISQFGTFLAAQSRRGETRPAQTCPSRRCSAPC